MVFFEDVNKPDTMVQFYDPAFGSSPEELDKFMFNKIAGHEIPEDPSEASYLTQKAYFNAAKYLTQEDLKDYLPKFFSNYTSDEIDLEKLPEAVKPTYKVIKTALGNRDFARLMDLQGAEEVAPGLPKFILDMKMRDIFWQDYGDIYSEIAKRQYNTEKPIEFNEKNVNAFKDRLMNYVYDKAFEQDSRISPKTWSEKLLSPFRTDPAREFMQSNYGIYSMRDLSQDEKELVSKKYLARKETDPEKKAQATKAAQELEGKISAEEGLRAKQEMFNRAMRNQSTIRFDATPGGPAINVPKNLPAAPAIDRGAANTNAPVSVADTMTQQAPAAVPQEQGAPIKDLVEKQPAPAVSEEKKDVPAEELKQTIPSILASKGIKERNVLLDKVKTDNPMDAIGGVKKEDIAPWSLQSVKTFSPFMDLKPTEKDVVSSPESAFARPSKLQQAASTVKDIVSGAAPVIKNAGIAAAAVPAAVSLAKGTEAGAKFASENPVATAVIVTLADAATGGLIGGATGAAISGIKSAAMKLPQAFEVKRKMANFNPIDFAASRGAYAGTGLNLGQGSQRKLQMLSAGLPPYLRSSLLNTIRGKKKKKPRLFSNYLGFENPTGV